MNKLNPTAMGLASGILWALGAFTITLTAIYLNYGSVFVELMSSVYLGVDISLKGAFLILPWSFVDAFIGGFLLAWIYNRFV